MEQVGRRMSDVGGQLTRSLTLPLVAVGGGAVKAFADFDGAMTKSLAIMGNVSSELRGEMTAAARQMAKETIFSAEQAAESYFFLASAGLDAKSSVAALPTVSKFAQAGMFDMALATDLLTDAQSALGLTIRDDVVRNMENMNRVSDVLVRANTLANATVQQFSESLTNEAGAALKSFNIDVEEGVAVLAAFADQGVKGNVAGTGLSRILRLMTSAAVKNADAYKEMGVAVFDSQGKIRNLADIVVDLEKALGNLSDEQRVAALEALGFQARVQGVILPLLGTSEAIRTYEKELRSAAGFTESVAEKQLESFTNQLKLLRNQLVDAGITLGEAMVPALKDFVDSAVLPTVGALAGLAKAFGSLPEPIRAIIVALVALVAAAGPALFVTGQLITAWGTLAAAAPGVAAGITLIGRSFLTLASGPVGILVAGVVTMASVVNDQIKKMAAESARDIDAMVKDIDRLKGAVDGLREAARRGVITDDEILAARRGLQEVTKELAAIDRKLKFSSDRSEREGLIFRRGVLESEQRSIEDWLQVASRLPRINEEIEVSAEGAGGPPGGVTGLGDSLKDALESISATVAESKALIAALDESQRAYDILNTLLEAGIPLADALTGAYDKQADQLLKTEAALQMLIDARAEEEEIAKRILELEEEIAQRRDSVIDTTSKIEPPDLEAAFPVPSEEQIGAMTEAWEQGIGKMAKATEAIMEQAWSNVQDIASGAIAEILKTGKVNWKDLGESLLDVIAQMLAKMLTTWLANLAVRLKAELAAAAAARAAWSGVGATGGGGGGGGWMSALGSLFGGGGGSSAATAGTVTQSYDSFSAAQAVQGGNTGWAAGGALGALAIAGVVVAFAAWASSEAAKKAAKRWFDVATVRDGWNAMFGSPEVMQVAERVRDGIRQFFAVIGGDLESLPDISVQVQATGERFRSFVDGVLVGVFSSFEEAFEAAALEAVAQSDLSRIIPEIAEALTAGTIQSADELGAVTEVLGQIAQVTEPIALQVRQFSAEIDSMKQVLLEAGISAAVLAEYTAAGWAAIRASITGTTEDAAKLFELRREQFNREIGAERAREEAALAAAQAQYAAAEADLARTQAQIAQLQALAELNEMQAQFLANLLNSIAVAEAALAAAGQAAADAQSALDALPDPISPDEFRGGGSGRGGQRRSDMDQLRETLEQMRFDRLLLGMTELEAGLARLDREYQQQLELAHGNAELIAALNAEYAAQQELLRQQIQLSAVDTFQGFIGIGQDPFAQLRDGWEAARTAVEEAGFGADRAAKMLGRLDRAYQKQLKTLSKAQFVSIGDSLMGILERYYGGVEGFEDFRVKLEQFRFDLEVANLRVQFEILKAQGALSNAVLARMQEVFKFIDENPVDWDKFVAPPGGGGGGGGGNTDDPLRKYLDALSQLREIQARSLSPLMQSIRSVVDEFAYLRTVIGWTAEVQAVYAQEIRRVLMEQLEPIRRLQEELAFRGDSPMRSIDQFRLAQQQLNEAMAALRGGDLSVLEEIPDLARRVLDLNPSAQASEASRFLVEWINRILAEAQTAAEKVATGIEPGGPNDPFAWLRVEPTAGDTAVRDAIYDIGRDLVNAQDETTTAVNVGNQILRKPAPAPAREDPASIARKEARDADKVRLLAQIAGNTKSLTNKQAGKLTLAGAA